MPEEPHNEDPSCDDVGWCEAADGERRVTNCIHCGKELLEREGWWWTWDAIEFDSPRPQCAVR